MIAVIVGSVIAFGSLMGAFWVLRRKRLIDDLPTSKTQGVFIGLVELKGTAECESPLTSNLAGKSCVQYNWVVEEHWSRTVRETYKDAQGKTQTRTRTESGWKRVAGEEKSVPFYLKDDTGVIRVVPDRAKIDNDTVFNRSCSRNDPLYFGKGPRREIANTTHTRRFRESLIPLHATLYIMGHAREREDIVAAEIAHDKSAPMYLISTSTEEQLSRRYAIWSWFWILFGLAAAVVGAVIWQIQSNAGFRWQPVVIAAAIFAGVLALGWIWTVYNSLIDLRNRVGQGQSQVDVQLKRRHDLIPNLVNAVQGYRDHESETQQLVTELRNQQQATPPGAIGPDLKGVAPTLKLTVERYPEFKAD
jgi:hypothetical protein